MCQCVPNFLSYVSAKYYLNWFRVGKDITKIKRVNFLLRHGEDMMMNKQQSEICCKLQLQELRTLVGSRVGSRGKYLGRAKEKI